MESYDRIRKRYQKDVDDKRKVINVMFCMCSGHHRRRLTEKSGDQYSHRSASSTPTANVTAFRPMIIKAVLQEP